MQKYTANYSRTNPNFVIQNLHKVGEIDENLFPLLCTLKNILQRGVPTLMSKFLQQKIGEIHKNEDFKKDFFLFVSPETQKWNNTIKGDKERNYFPAQDFYEKILPAELGDYAFVQSLIIPEIEINEICGENERFEHQQVDFYIPLAKLVIEIDGEQHKNDKIQQISDTERNEYLARHRIKVVRITTDELRQNAYSDKIDQIKERISEYKKEFDFYQKFYDKIKTNSISEEDLQTKLIPTAVIRFQILVLELLCSGQLSLENAWKFNIRTDEYLGRFAQLAIDDIFIWLDNLSLLRDKKSLKKPETQIDISTKKEFKFDPNAINIDFSLFKRYTDENENEPKVLFVRTDYFERKEKNYFRVSSSNTINYNISKGDEPVLEFFLQNIFDKPSFRNGQFPIIANALNRRDTIGLLPTGSGKSLCYQLPCLLQPSVNFVVCPIKSLMEDQYDNLQKIWITNVNYINSSLEGEERRAAETDFQQGKCLFTLISPEKFQIPKFREIISDIISKFSIAYGVIDEVHCLSEWGHDFRTSYLNLAKTIDKLSPKDENGEGQIKFLGLTATASVNVLKDIKIEFSRQKYRLDDSNIKSLLDYSRKELYFEVINDKDNKFSVLEDILKKENFLNSEEKAGLIFTPNVNGKKGCYNVANMLSAKYPNKVNWFSGSVPKVDLYDENGYKIGKTDLMSEKDFEQHKKKVQKGFKDNKYPLMVATKAFGMGIDKSNIFYTFHYGLPSSVEALYQEAGRAGRWEKTEENNEEIAKCFVLHSHEIVEQVLVNRLFEQNTTIQEIKEIQNEVKWSGKDIFSQIFLFLQGQRDVQEEIENIEAVINKYFKENEKVKIPHTNLLPFKNDIFEKIIYRLSLLGIVKDWTNDFYSHFEVEFGTCNDENLIKSLENYIGKYEPTRNIRQEIEQVQEPTFLRKSMRYLLEWIFNHIVYNRKQSLKTLSDWCSEFTDNESFKKRIDSYFTFSDITFVLQDIGENPMNFDTWFKVFYFDEETNVFLENGEYERQQKFIPELKDANLKNEKYQNLRDALSRFLESYQSNIGLNFISGMVRLALNEFSDLDGKTRLENAFKNIKILFAKKEDRERILHKIKRLCVLFEPKQQEELCILIREYFGKQVFISFAEAYNLPHLLTDIYEGKINKLKKLNNKLYEQLAKI